MRKRQLRGLFDEISSITRELVGDDVNITDACVDEATAEIASYDANIDDVIDNWKPTNFYTPDQLREIVSFGLKCVSVVRGGLLSMAQQSQLQSHRNLIVLASQRLDEDQDGGIIDIKPFQEALAGADAQAKTTNKPVIIESTGLKRWVVNVLKSCRRARFMMAAINCARPGTILSILSTARDVTNGFASFVRTIFGVAKSAVEAAGAVIMVIPDLLSTIIKIVKVLPWFVVIGGGYYAATKTFLPPKYDPLKLRDRETFKPWKKKAGLNGLKRLSVPGGRF